MNMLNEVSVQMLSFCDRVFCFYISLGREDWETMLLTQSAWISGVCHYTQPQHIF